MYMDEARGRKSAKSSDTEQDTENIIMQLRKSVYMRGLKDVKFTMVKNKKYLTS